MVWESVPKGTQSCPKDGTRLELTNSVDTGGPSVGNLTCPRCKTDYAERDVPTGGDRYFLAPPFEVSTVLESTSQEIQAAQGDIGRLLARFEDLDGRLAEMKSRTTPSSDESFRAEVSELRRDLEGIDARIEKAKEAFAALLPDVTDLAYLKMARADATELRNLITKHVEEDHRRRTDDRSLRANRLASVAIVVSIVGALVALLSPR